MLDLTTFVVLRERMHPLFFPPSYVFIHYLEDDAKELLGHTISAFVVIFDDNFRKIGFVSNEDDRILKQKLVARICTDENFVALCHKKFENHAKALVAFCNEEKRKKPTREYLIQQLNRYTKHYMKTNYWVACHMFWSADGLRVHIEEEMKIFVSDKKRRIEYTETLSTPLKRSYVVVEELALLQLIHLLPPHLRKLIEDEQYTDIIIAIMKEEYPAIYRKLVSHTKSFAFVPFGYIGPCCWSIDDILKRIKEMLKKGNYNDRRQKLESYRPALEEKQREIIENLALPLYLQRLFADLRRIAVMQDKRKMYCTRSHVFLNQYLLHHISKKTNIPLSLLRVMTVREIRDVLKGKHFSLKKLYQRRKKAILCITKDKFDVYTGKEADAVLKTLESNSKEVKGLVGSSGRAKGDVSLILSAQDIGKMKKGNILVAPSTTPDFLPAMAIAAAIVTNDGGITSHAAIVSRELGIPCIIGTKNATRMLHNDDFVEVDAEKGIVKIIK